MLWSDPPTPRTQGRKFRNIMFRLAVGMPVRDYNRPTGPTFFRSANAVKTRPNRNPCRNWPGWIKILWRILLIPILPFWWNPLRYTDPIVMGVVHARQIAWGFAAMSITVFVCAWYSITRGKREARMPNRVSWATEFVPGDILKPPVGQTKGKKWFRLNLREDPHGIVAARTGYGKTTYMLLLMLWFWLHGAEIHIIDPKILSFRHLRGIPRITIYTEENWAYGVKKFYDSMMNYYRAVDADDKDAIKKYEGSFHALFVDEMGSFTEIMEEEEGSKSETLALLKRCLRMGREANHQVFVGAQQASKPVMLSTETRDQFSNKVALGPQKKESWQCLMGESRIRYRKKKGRGLHYSGDVFTELQVTYLTIEEVADIMRRHLQTEIDSETSSGPVPVRDTPHVPQPRGNPDSMSQDNGSNTEIGVSTSGQPGEIALIVGIKNGADFLKMSEAAFIKGRKRRAIQGEIRVGNRPAWTEAQLWNWRNKCTGTGEMES